MTLPDLMMLKNRQKDVIIKNKDKRQVIWGILLISAGIGVFFRVPQVMPEIEKIEQFLPVLLFIRLCFYLLGILLIGGGSKKVYNYLKILENRSSNNH